MIFRQLYDSTSSTYTYLLGCEGAREAVVIDPVYEQFDRDTALIRELGLRVLYVLDTHVHADHVTAAWRLRKALGADVVLSDRYGAQGVTKGVDHGDRICFGGCELEVRATPGHTAGCLTYVTGDHNMAFTGDCLMIRGAGRTDFQGGDVHTMWHSIREQIFSLPDHCLIYPGHDYAGRTVSTVGEERQYNPRIGGEAREEDFAGFMDNLGLPHPRLLEIAVPANLKSGEPDHPDEPAPQSWAPITISFAGIPEISPVWVATHHKDVHVLDVRSEAEYCGDLGHIDGAQLIPLSELRDRTDELPQDQPIVVACQSGRRSAMATNILKAAGFDKVANVTGGMLQWCRLGLPISPTG